MPLVTDRASFAYRQVGLVLAVQAGLLLVMSPFYGPHRDELYFVACGQRLAWGYPDQPSFTPLLARLATEVAPHHLSVLRLPAILAAVGIALLGSHFARLLGGAAGAQTLSATVIAASVVTMTIGHRLNTAVFDTLAWTAILVLVTQAIHDQRPRLWLLAGVIAGIGLNNKHAVVFLVLAVLVACALDPAARPALRTRWPWLAGLVALAMWVPNLVWQAQHGWPAFALSADIAAQSAGVDGRVAMVAEAAIMFSPVILLVWLTGMVKLLRAPQWRLARLPALAFLVAILAFLVTGGKGYYLAGAIVPLVAAGCAWLARAATRRRLFTSGVLLVLSAAVAWPAMVPLLPASTYATSFYSGLDDDQPETIGWSGYVDQIRGVVDSLPPAERSTTVIFTQNYGEAGALEWYGVGVPVYSGHNGWQAWGPPPEPKGHVVVVGYEQPAEHFTGCRHAATLHNALGIDNVEAGQDVSVCNGPTGGWAEQWHQLEHYDA